jgi:hypothetical protein
MKTNENATTKIDSNSFININSQYIDQTKSHTDYDETMNNLSCLDDDFILNDDDDLNDNENELINVPNSILDF